MKAKIAIFTLAVGCAVLGGMLWFKHSVAVESEATQGDVLRNLQSLTNDLARSATQIESQYAVNQKLDEEARRWQSESNTLSNELNTAMIALTRAQTEAKAAADAADAVLRQRDLRIKEVEGERDELAKAKNELREMITALEQAISETKRRLAASEGDREVLASRLKQLQTEKTELEGKFNNLAALQEQVRRVREEIVVARRRDWNSRGLAASDSMKGAERLMRGFPPATFEVTSTPVAKPNYNLDVELRRDGSARVSTNVTATPQTVK